MPPERDLDRLLAMLDIERRPGLYTFVTNRPDLAEEAAAMVVEEEGRTHVVPVDAARRAAIDVEFEAAWLTLTVHSALEAVGLTAAVSTALANEGIACNVLAGHHHDHLLVPAHRADDAMAAILRLADR